MLGVKVLVGIGVDVLGEVLVLVGVNPVGGETGSVG